MIALAALFVNWTEKSALLSLSECRCVPGLLHRLDKFTVVFEAKPVAWAGVLVIFHPLREQ